MNYEWDLLMVNDITYCMKSNTSEFRRTTLIIIIMMMKLIFSKSD